jgi:hypothetical protein
MFVFCLAGYAQERQEEARRDAKGVTGTEESPTILNILCIILVPNHV